MLPQKGGQRFHAQIDDEWNGSTYNVMIEWENGENQLTEKYGECHPAIKDHSKDLDNDGEITIKLISTIATDDPITNAPNDSTCLSIISLCGDGGQCNRAWERSHVHVSQVIGVHDKNLDNNGEITTMLIATIATDDSITDVLTNRHISAWNYLDVNAVHIATYRCEFGFTNCVPEMTIIDAQTKMDPALDHGDMHATLLDHAMQCTWRKTNDCDDVWCLINGNGQCIRTQDMNRIQWQMPALRIVFRAYNHSALSSLEEDGECIHKHVNKLDECNGNTQQWCDDTALELAILTKHGSAL
jgi:hypothetical protein